MDTDAYVMVCALMRVSLIPWCRHLGTVPRTAPKSCSNFFGSLAVPYLLAGVAVEGFVALYQCFEVFHFHSCQL